MVCTVFDYLYIYVYIVNGTVQETVLVLDRFDFIRSQFELVLSPHKKRHKVLVSWAALYNLLCVGYHYFISYFNNKKTAPTKNNFQSTRLTIWLLLIVCVTTNFWNHFKNLCKNRGKRFLFFQLIFKWQRSYFWSILNVKASCKLRFVPWYKYCAP